MSYFIGITGGSASGKTYLLEQIQTHFKSHELSLISQDNYYRDYALQLKEADGSVNFDHPQSVDLEALSSDIQQLKQGIPIERLEYTFNNPDKTPKMIVVQPTPIVIIEGLFIYYHPEIAQQIDFKIFIDTHDYVRLTRRLLRDQKDRGRTTESVLEEYNKYVAPMYRRFVAPFKEDADIIIPNHQAMHNATEMVLAFLKHKLNP